MKTGLLFLILIFAGSSALTHTSYEHEIKCPVDGEKFKIYVTGSYTTFGTYMDFQKHGAIGDLYESSVNSCPKCHFSGYQDDFDTTFSEESKAEILQILLPFEKLPMTDVVENEITIAIYLWQKRDNDAIAWLYLVASYFLRTDQEQILKRKELQRNCIMYLKKAIELKEYEEQETYATMYYLIGEMYRRVGEFENAIVYYDIALDAKKKPDWLEEIATGQKEMALKSDDDNNI